MGKIRVYIAGDWLSDFYTSEYVAIVTDYGHFDFFNRNKDGDILKSQENDKNINPQDENKLPYSIRILHKAVKGQTYNRAKLLGLIDTLNYLNTSKRTIIYTNSTYLTDTLALCPSASFRYSFMVFDDNLFSKFYVLR